METESLSAMGVVVLKDAGEGSVSCGLARLKISFVVGGGDAYERMRIVKDIWLEPDRISRPLKEVAVSAGMIDVLH